MEQRIKLSKGQGFALGALIVACLVSPVVGVVLAIMFDNAAWLLLCAPIILFLS